MALWREQFLKLDNAKEHAQRMWAQRDYGENVTLECLGEHLGATVRTVAGGRDSQLPRSCQAKIVCSGTGRGPLGERSAEWSPSGF